jgi:hypothetical protein
MYLKASSPAISFRDASRIKLFEREYCISGIQVRAKKTLLTNVLGVVDMREQGLRRMWWALMIYRCGHGVTTARQQETSRLDSGAMCATFATGAK